MIVDVPDASRIGEGPDEVRTILNTRIMDRGFEIRRVELRMYRTGGDVITTTAVYTDKGDIEMLYSEGRQGGSIDDIARFITSNLGVSGIILRSVIALEAL